MGAAGNASRRAPGNALPAVGADTPGAAQHAGVGTGDPAPGLDAQTKTVGAAERNEQPRSASRKRIATRDLHALVVIDEGGANINLTPRSARAPRGQRAYASVPRKTDTNTPLIAAMSSAGMGAA